jgi:hypothetical protein
VIREGRSRSREYEEVAKECKVHLDNHLKQRATIITGPRGGKNGIG